MRKPKIKVEKGRFALDPPEPYDEADHHGWSSASFCSSAVSFTTLMAPNRPWQAEHWAKVQPYKPTAEEIMVLAAERTEALRKKGKSDHEIEVILKDMLEDFTCDT